MRVLLVLLLLGNLLFFAAWQGWLGPVLPQQYEPQRLDQQIAPEKMQLLSTADLETAAKPRPPEPKPAPLACLEWGGFAAPALARADALLAPLTLGNRVTRVVRNEGASYAVIMGPYIDRPTAERKLAELLKLGILEGVIYENVVGRFISLGLFSKQENAKAYFETLSKRGVKTARVETRGTGIPKTFLQVRPVEAELEAKLRGLSGDLGDAAWNTCN
jgi:hypothetical protein